MPGTSTAIIIIKTAPAAFVIERQLGLVIHCHLFLSTPNDVGTSL